MDVAADMTYSEPLALVIVSSISIGIAAASAIWIALDIVLRRDWRSMMAIMIPVYILNALYLWPITLWTYLNYGRPPKLSKDEPHTKTCHQQQGNCLRVGSDSQDLDIDKEEATHPAQNSNIDINSHSHHHFQHEPPGQEEKQHDSHNHHLHNEQSKGHEMHQMHRALDRPLFATITIAVCHCGAGCVLGDTIEEWIVYATGATLGQPPRSIWVKFLVDFAFAFVFGIFFQYFSIAPMAGEYSPKILLRALKADALSLLSFEVGLLSWMAAFQIGIFGDSLPMSTVAYWWMMQIGVFIGQWTGVPINYWLINNGVKEPCSYERGRFGLVASIVPKL